MATIQEQVTAVDRWISGYRIGVTAYFATRRVATLPAEALYGDNILTVLGAHLQPYVDPAEPSEQLRNLKQLPPSSLVLLADMLDRVPAKALRPSIAALKGPVNRAIRDLGIRRAEDGTTPAVQDNTILAAAEVLASHILYSSASAVQILALAMEIEEGRSDKNDPREERRRRLNEFRHVNSNIERLDDLLERLRCQSFNLCERHRDFCATTKTRIDVVGQLSVLLGELSHWRLVENVLFARCFCWPVLTFPGQATVAVALPVAVDMTFDGRSEVRIRRHVQKVERDKRWEFFDAIIRGDEVTFTPLREEALSGVNVTGWIDNFRSSVQRAKLLWSSKHSNSGPEFRHKIHTASVDFDFTWANKLAPDEIEELTGESADAYFTLTVLQVLLGHPAFFATPVLALVGDPTDVGQDYYVAAPGSLEEKLRLIHASRTNEKAAVGRDPEEPRTSLGIETGPEGIQSRDIRQSVMIAEGAKLSNLADIALSRPWRQWQYVRCQELMWDVYGWEDDEFRAGLYMDEDGQITDDDVRTVLDAIQKGEGCLDLRGEPQMTARRVLTALWHLTTEDRRRSPDTSWLPPMMSWLFIRPIPEEQDSRFWELIWEACGAPPEEFYKVRLAATSDAAAEALEAVLNKFEPDESRPGHRAPDVIVIVGSNDERSEDPRYPSVRTNSVNNVIEALGLRGKLHRVALHKRLGGTRIIQVSDSRDGEKEVNHPDLNLYGDTVGMLRALATFRWGFTPEMASLMLNDERLREKRRALNKPADGMIAVPAYLDQLRRQKLLRHARGWYHIPAGIRKTVELMKLDDPEAWPTTAELHLAAGTALAPYTVHASLGGLPLDIAFRFEHVNEASYHFVEARDRQKVGTTAMRRLSRLLRYAAPPSQGTLSELARRDRNAATFRLTHELGLRFLSQYDKANAGRRPHPFFYLNPASNGARWLRTDNEASDTDKDELSKKVSRLFDSARAGCDERFWTSEQAGERKRTLLRVLSEEILSLVTLSATSRGTEEIEDRIAEAIGQVREMIESGVDPRGPAGEFWECAGDRCEDDEEATYFYGIGVVHASLWHQLWVKSFGTRWADPDWIIERVREEAEDRQISESELARTILDRVAYTKLRETGKPWAEVRWNRGFAFILSRWGISRRRKSS